VKAAGGERFIAWIISPAGQRAIASCCPESELRREGQRTSRAGHYRINAEPRFFPNATQPEPIS